MSMPTRKIGDKDVSCIGFGAMGISAFYGSTESDEERFKILDRAHELGCHFWDTADMYQDSEDLIGKWFARTGKRSDIFLATKYGFTKEFALRADAEYVRQSVAKSLKRLQTDHIDLYYLHRVSKDTPIEESVGAMAEFVKSGQISYLGLSECSSTALRRACAVHHIAAIQVEYSPFTLDIEDEKIGLLKTARELGVKIVAYSPLGRGFLTGQYKSIDDFEENDFRRHVPFYKNNFDKILALADDLKAIGAKHGVTAGQACLAWILAQGDDFLPIPGTKKIKYLEENIAAAKVKLSKEDIQEVRAAIKRAGMDSTFGRYPEGMMEMLFEDSPPLKK